MKEIYMGDNRRKIKKVLKILLIIFLAIALEFGIVATYIYFNKGNKKTPLVVEEKFLGQEKHILPEEEFYDSINANGEEFSNIASNRELLVDFTIDGENYSSTSFTLYTDGVFTKHIYTLQNNIPRDVYQIGRVKNIKAFNKYISENAELKECEVSEEYEMDLTKVDLNMATGFTFSHDLLVFDGEKHRNVTKDCSVYDAIMEKISKLKTEVYSNQIYYLEGGFDDE